MVLPPWLEPLPDAAAQRQLDAWAIERRGIPGTTLMERAGAGLAARCQEIAPEGVIAVVCGPGNNGGDGLVAARLLRERGRAVRVLLLADVARIHGDAAVNLRRLEGEAPEPFQPQLLEGARLIVDAILGTGFSGQPREPVAGAIAAINRIGGRGPGASAASAVVVACDVPSGVDASAGEVASVAVRADATVTFHAAKPGLWIAPGKGHVGTVTVVDIGIPADERPELARAGLIGEAVLAEIPRRRPGQTKFGSGVVLVCGGSRGLTGAPVLASSAAARAGAGYVTVAVPDSLVAVMQVKLLEVMSLGLAEVGGGIAPTAVAEVLERSRRSGCVVVGPGLGRAAATQEFARELTVRCPRALLLDADGLNAHAAVDGGLELLASRTAATVLTPHAGELARLLGCESAEIDAHRLKHARDAAARAGAVVVLKGDDTVVADPTGRVAVSRGGAPMLATAGTGDVLSGVIGAYLAKGMDPFTAACAGVQVHVRAGQLAAARVGGGEGVVAGDVVAALPAVLG